MSNIKDLESQIIHHKILYYKGQAEISDEEYDQLEKELRQIDPDNSVLNIVGTPVVNNKVKHDKKMLSLGKTYKAEDLIKWMKDYELISTFKIDGSSCSLVYVDGKFLLGKTRGDGEFGENLSEKLDLMDCIPKHLKNISGKVEVRGEIYCDDHAFTKISEEMDKLGLDRPTSKRNIVAGLLGRKENYHLVKYLKFQAFELFGSQLNLKLEEEKFNLLKENNFLIPEVTKHKLAETIKNSIEEAQIFINEGDYLIDGLVFTYNELKVHEELGETAHHPRYKMAFKFVGDTKTATLKEITWQVSRNGILTPVAEVEPVELSGAMISRVTLHNYGLVKSTGLACGDEIEIIRSGEVIPKFLRVVNKSKNKQVIPTNCPSCNTEVEIEDIRLICINDACPAKKLESIQYFCSKIGIEDISRKRIASLLRAKLIQDIPDLYKLTIDDLLTLEKTKEKLAQKIIDNIKATTNVGLVKFLSTLGINGGAINKCEKIVNGGFDTLDKIQSMTAEQLSELEGFAEKSSNDFVSSLKEKSELISNLLKYIKVEDSVALITEEGRLSGFSFCITGTLTRKRTEVANIIKNNGGKVLSSVTSKTNYLVTNDTESTSSKFKKAISLNIPIINEDKLDEMIQK